MLLAKSYQSFLSQTYRQLWKNQREYMCDWLELCPMLIMYDCNLIIFIKFINRNRGMMASMLISSAVDRGFEPLSGQPKDYKICICCFSAKYTALREKSKDWLARNRNNVFEWRDMSTRGLLFQWP